MYVCVCVGVGVGVGVVRGRVFSRFGRPCVWVCGCGRVCARERGREVRELKRERFRKTVCVCCVCGVCACVCVCVCVCVCMCLCLCMCDTNACIWIHIYKVAGKWPTAEVTTPV